MGTETRVRANGELFCILQVSVPGTATILLVHFQARKGQIIDF